MNKDKNSVIKSGKVLLTMGIIFSVLLFLPLIIAINDTIGAVILVVVLYVIISPLLILGVRMKKNPEKYIKTSVSYIYGADSTIYLNKGYTYDIACNLYCKRTGKTNEELTEADEDEIWHCSYDDFTYLMAWIIENGYYQYSSQHYGEDGEKGWMKTIDKIKNRTYEATDFFLLTDGVLFKDEISDQIVDFIQEYSNSSLCNDGQFYLKEGNVIGGLEVDVQDFARKQLNSDIYGFKFKWDDYDKFKVYIDTAYKKYLDKVGK